MINNMILVILMKKVNKVNILLALIYHMSIYMVLLNHNNIN